MNREFHIAEANIAHRRAPMDHPSLADFVARLEPLNALADRSPGLVWCLESLWQNGRTADAFTFRTRIDPEA